MLHTCTEKSVRNTGWLRHEIPQAIRPVLLIINDRNDRLFSNNIIRYIAGCFLLCGKYTMALSKQNAKSADSFLKKCGLAARSKSTIGRAHRACDQASACEASSRREEEANAAQCKHCGDIVDDKG
jgi:hypothetical protein